MACRQWGLLAGPPPVYVTGILKRMRPLPVYAPWPGWLRARHPVGLIIIILLLF